jgi:competence ComEA-like helix-hairpin-helix protein
VAAPTRKEGEGKVHVFAHLRTLMGRPAARAALALCGLVVLSLVGRFAVAGGQASPAAASGDHVEPLPPAPPMAATPLAAPAAEGVEAGAPQPIAHAARATADDPVYLNDATVDDLRRLPGIGPKRALAILELRRKLGRLHQVEDLLRVKGIGRATLRKLRPLVRIERPAATADAGAGGAPP